MNVVSIEDIRERIEARRQDLVRILAGREEIAIERTPDKMDSLRNAVDRHAAATLLERHCAGVREIDATLSRLESGAYGVCNGCGKAISPRRLTAVPTALLCIGCQEEADEIAA